MESLASGYLVNLGGCLGLQAQPVDDQLGLPLVFVGIAPDLLVDGTGIRSGGTEVRFGERVRVGGGQFDAPTLADAGTRESLDVIPEECPIDGFLFVAQSIELE